MLLPQTINRSVRPRRVDSSARIRLVVGAILSFNLILTTGCSSLASFNQVKVEEKRQSIENDLNVKINLDAASPLRGDTWRTLDKIKAALKPFPIEYRKKIPEIRVAEDFYSRFGLAALAVAAYVEDEREDENRIIFIKNKNLLEEFIGLLELDIGTHLPHESWHSVEYYEIERLRVLKSDGGKSSASLSAKLERLDANAANVILEYEAEPLHSSHHYDYVPSLTQYLALIKGWLYAHFADANEDGKVDDDDVAYLDAHRREFDANRDGKITYEDVSKSTRYGYLEAESPLSLELQLGMSLQLLPGYRPKGFCSFYAKNFAWEDRAETLEAALRRGFIPFIYKAGVPEVKQERAWKKLTKIKSEDPVLGRKFELILRYIAHQEKQENLSQRWKSNYGQQARKISASG